MARQAPEFIHIPAENMLTVCAQCKVTQGDTSAGNSIGPWFHIEEPWLDVRVRAGAPLVWLFQGSVARVSKGDLQGQEGCSALLPRE